MTIASVLDEGKQEMYLSLPPLVLKGQADYEDKSDGLLKERRDRKDNDEQ